MYKKQVIVNNIAKEMKRQNIAQEKMAEYTGISRSTLHKILKQNNSFSIDFLIKASEYLNTEIFNLFIEETPGKVNERQSSYNRIGIKEDSNVLMRLIDVLKEQFHKKDEQIKMYAEQNRQCLEQIAFFLQSNNYKAKK